MKYKCKTCGEPLKKLKDKVESFEGREYHIYKCRNKQCPWQDILYVPVWE